MITDVYGNEIEIGDEVERICSEHRGMKNGDKAIVLDFCSDHIRFATFKGNHDPNNFKIISKANNQTHNLTLIL